MLADQFTATAAPETPPPRSTILPVNRNFRSAIFETENELYLSGLTVP
jgi:hypothetical protein